MPIDKSRIAEIGLRLHRILHKECIHPKDRIRVLLNLIVIHGQSSIIPTPKEEILELFNEM
jgi:hypothetical protein